MANNILKTGGKLYRNSFSILEITNRLGRKFFQVGSVIRKAFPTHLPVISSNIFQKVPGQSSLLFNCLRCWKVFFLKCTLILLLKPFTSSLTLCEQGGEMVLFVFAAHLEIFT